MKQLLKTITLLLALFSFVSANETGSASIFSFYNGVALEKNEVLLDGKYSYFTDADGSVELILETGEHQIEVFAKDENCQNLGYVKKIITIKESRDTQVIVTFQENTLTPHVEVDTPLGTSALAAAAQESTETGIFHGIVLTSDKNLPIKNARVFVKGTSIDAKTDEKGNFYVEIPAQTKVSLSIVHSEYSAQTINDVMVKKDETINQEIKLTPASMELEEFIVLAPKVEGSISALISEAKNAQSISSIIGSEQMSKQGDSNAAAALKRVAGVTIIGGKSVYVRGLGERYSATELNGLSLPSPNPMKRTVPLDMFPSGVIGSLQVQKSGSADISGAFGGGYVNIRTKDEFADDYAKVKVGLRAHSSTGEDAITSQGSSTDFFGKDDGYRSFNAAFADTLQAKIGESAPDLIQSNAEIQNVLRQRDINQQTTTVPLGYDFGVDFGKKFKLSENQELYLLAEYEYKSRNRNIEYDRIDYDVLSTGEQSEVPFNESGVMRSVTTIQHGGLFKLGYKYKSLDLKFSKLYVLNTLDQARINQGTFGDNNSDEQQTYLEWQERELDVNQFTGGFDYKIVVPNRFDFGLEFATATEFVPNDVTYSYLKRRNSDDYQFARRQSSLDYLHRSTDDEVLNFNLKNKIEIPLLSQKDYLEIGYVNQDKSRQSRIAKLRMQSTFNNDDIASGPINGVIGYEDPDRLDFDITSQVKENFDASLDQSAYFAKAFLAPTEELSLTLGLRNVTLNQTINQFNAPADVVTTEENALDFDKTLPSLSLIYSINKSNQVKLAYSETFIYPDFREFSDVEFIHPEFIAKVAGNPDLIETDIQSYDLEYGYYFDDTDNITAAIFYKHLQNPIEDVRTFTTSTFDRFSFDNSDAADLYGLELSWYKNLGFLSKYTDNLTLFGNYTFIESEVTLTDEQKAKFVSAQRGLQGLSPEVLNLSIMYQDKERSLNLAYNKMSKRLMRVALKNGDVILGLDDYEEPPHLLDFTWIEKFKSEALQTDVAMTFKIKNLLDSETVWTQNDKVTLKYKEGVSYSLSLGAKF